jgi:hypothetical protein
VLSTGCRGRREPDERRKRVRLDLRLHALRPPPRFIRATLWRYTFTRPGDGDPAWWRRMPIGQYLRPIALDDPALAPLRW